ncbi:Bifunctional solanapyrone synthase, partial [Diplodia seriata]
CDALIHAGLRDRLLLPTSPSYEARIETWWALNTRLRPWCLIQPHTTAEVSTALTALLNTTTSTTTTTTEYSAGAGDWHIAIRAGGHSVNPHANNIDAGVTIDLGALNATTYDRDTNVASIGPGGRWKDVYAALREGWGVAVAGGRDGGVGVGGFLLGGGLTYFMGRRGFACDAVRAFEVVLANGSVVEATRDNEHGDLWRALKGGGGQFGVVTRFDVDAVPDRDLAYGIRFMDARYAPALVDVLVDFTDRYEEGSGDALVAFLTYNASINAGAPVAAAIHVNTDGERDSPGFAGLNRIPSLQPDSTRAMPLADAASESQLSSGTWNAGATLSFKNDARILSHALALHSQLTASLSASLAPASFQSTIFLQPLPAFLGAISARAGGNILGLGSSSHHQQQQTRNAIIWTGAVAVTTGPRDLAVARTALMGMARELRDFAEGLGGGDGFVYMNYADAAQDPLGGYGAGSVALLRDVAARYDPLGAFQTRVSGGFKVSRVVGV